MTDKHDQSYDRISATFFVCWHINENEIESKEPNRYGTEMAFKYYINVQLCVGNQYEFSIIDFNFDNSGKGLHCYIVKEIKIYRRGDG